MKRVLVLLACVAFIGSMATAQVSFTGGPHAGIAISSFPKGMSDYYGLGYQFGAQGEVALMKALSLRLGFDYNMFPLDKDKFGADLAREVGVAANDLEVSGLTARIISVNVNGIGKIQTGSSVTPYGIVGLGLNFLSFSDPKVTYQGNPVTGLSAGDSETKFGIHFGAGTEFGLGGATLFVEVKYAMVFTENETTGYVPITVGVNF